MSGIQDTVNKEHPQIVKSHNIHIDADYAEWIAEIKHRYRSAQVKAAVRVNAEKLHQVGKEIPLSFALVPWIHHVEIITKCKSVAKGINKRKINQREKDYNK